MHPIIDLSFRWELDPDCGGRAMPVSHTSNHTGPTIRVEGLIQHLYAIQVIQDEEGYWIVPDDSLCEDELDAIMTLCGDVPAARPLPGLAPDTEWVVVFYPQGS